MKKKLALDFLHYKETKEVRLIECKSTPKKKKSELPDSGAIAAVMELSTDELITEMITRLQNVPGIRDDIAVEIILEELIHRHQVIKMILTSASVYMDNS